MRLVLFRRDRGAPTTGDLYRGERRYFDGT